MSNIACNEWLPTLSNLASRHVHVNPTCPLCCKHLETTTHALIGCLSLRQIRKAFPGLSGGVKADNLKMIAILFFYKRLLRPEEFHDFVILLWKVWSRRNALTHGSRCSSDDYLVLWCRSFLSEFQTSSMKRLADPVSHFVRRIPPDENCVKINPDAAIDVFRGVIVLGVVIRDCEGRVLLTGVKPMHGGFSPEIAEALAVLHALQIARESGFKLVALETDAINVVKLVNGAMVPLSLKSVSSFRIFVPFFQDSSFLSCLRVS
ncbi:hypothetical protein ACOSP7_024971 [Xanthoceras sorbifolium]